MIPVKPKMFFFFSLILAVAVTAQTKPAPTQIAWPVVTEPSILLVLPTGLSLAKLDASVIYDEATQTIKAKPLVYPTIRFSTEVLKPATGTDTWRIKAGCAVVALARNGVIQTELTDYIFVDYTLEGGTIKWRQASTPSESDLVTAICARQ